MVERKETKFQLIVNGKRTFVKWDCKITEIIKDAGKTLKLYIDYDNDIYRDLLKRKIGNFKINNGEKNG